MSDVLRIYVAGSSDERDRARGWMEKLRQYPKIQVMSTWCDTIDGEQHGTANPRDASDEDRERWALKNLSEVAHSHVVWFLVPNESHGRGGYYESGFAYNARRAHTVVFSGDTKQSVFCALGDEFATDQEAYDFILAEMGIS